MALCRMCFGTSIYQNRTCDCSKSGKRYFPKKAVKKKDDTLPSGHKHTNDLFLYETKSGMFFTCGCGQTHKVAL